MCAESDNDGVSNIPDAMSVPGANCVPGGSSDTVYCISDTDCLSGDTYAVPGYSWRLSIEPELRN